MSHRCYNMTWTPEFRQMGRAYLGLAIPAFIFHLLFWIQVATHKTLRQISMLWVYNYLFTDLLILIQLFTEYTLRTAIRYCISESVFYFFCNLEAFTTACMTVLEAYMLVCLNITRYFLIVKNCNISARYPYMLYMLNIFIYLFGISMLLFQVQLLQIVKLHSHEHTESCHYQFPNIRTQIGNLTIVLLIPIISNCYFMALTTLHVRRSQHAVRSQVNKNIQIRIFVFYFLSLA